MQFQGSLRFLQGQKRRTESGALLPPQLALFCVAVPLLAAPSGSELRLKGVAGRSKSKGSAGDSPDSSDRKPPSSRGSGDGGDFLLPDWTARGPPGPRAEPCPRHRAWSPLPRAPGLRCRGGGLHPQEEPLDFCLSSPGGGGPRAPPPPPGDPLPYWDPAPRGQLGRYPAPPQGRQGCGVRGASNGGCTQRGVPDPAERYGGGLDGFGGLLLPEPPAVKTEEEDPDPGGRGGRRPYGDAWEKQHYVASASVYPEHHPHPHPPHHHHPHPPAHQVKTEEDFYDPYSPCQRAKGGPPAGGPLNGHHKYLYAAAVTRLSSRSLYANRSPALFGPPPPAAAAGDPFSGPGPSPGGGAYPGADGYGGAEPKDYGGRASEADKLGYLEVRGGAPTAIKREPLDSPPWSDGQRGDGGQPAYCGLNALGRIPHQYIYMQ
ncbi:unnamed protein product [Arctogadus glacialis]